MRVEVARPACQCTTVERQMYLPTIRNPVQWKSVMPWKETRQERSRQPCLGWVLNLTSSRVSTSNYVTCQRGSSCTEIGCSGWVEEGGSWLVVSCHGSSRTPGDRGSAMVKQGLCYAAVIIDHRSTISDPTLIIVIRTLERPGGRGARLGGVDPDHCGRSWL